MDRFEDQELVDRPHDERPENELMKVTTEGNPSAMLARLEKTAELAPRFKQARDTILVSLTYADDWVAFGDGDKTMMCLKSAAAERVGTAFNIQFCNCRTTKEVFTDSIGEGYRYRTEITARLDDRQAIGVGLYSSRNKFLGSVGGDFKPIEDINENDIEIASYHIAFGAAIKALLGLRSIPKSEWQAIMERLGKEGQHGSKVKHGSGTKGGSSADDVEKRNELASMLMELSNAGFEIFYNEMSKSHEVIDSFAESPEEAAQNSCTQLTTFNGKDGVVKGIDIRKLGGKRLDIAIKTLKNLMDKENGK